MVVVSGVGHLILNPGRDATGTVGRLVETLIDNTSGKMPPRLEAAMSRRMGDGDASDGSCSVPGGYAGFADACRTHDLGYDLLRYASETGRPLGPWARLGMDRRFHHDMLSTCHGFGCRVLAHVYWLGVGLNSVRQGFTTPTKEPIAPWAMAAMLVIAVAAMASTPHAPTGTRRRIELPVPTTSEA